MLLSLTNHKGIGLMAGRAYLPQLQGIIRTGLWQLSLTKGKKERPDFKLVLKHKRPKNEYHHFFATMVMSETICRDFYTTIPLCARQLKLTFGIIPDTIYCTFLK